MENGDDILLKEQLTPKKVNGMTESNEDIALKEQLNDDDI